MLFIVLSSVLKTALFQPLGVPSSPTFPPTELFHFLFPFAFCLGFFIHFSFIFYSSSSASSSPCLCLSEHPCLSFRVSVCLPPTPPAGVFLLMEQLPLNRLTPQSLRNYLLPSFPPSNPPSSVSPSVSLPLCENLPLHLITLF